MNNLFGYFGDMNINNSVNVQFISTHHQQIQSDPQVESDKADLLSPWTKKKNSNHLQNTNQNKFNNYNDNQSLQINQHLYSIQMPNISSKKQVKNQEFKVSFRLTFNSLRTRRSNKQYSFLDAQLKQQKQDIQTIKARRQFLKEPKLLELDISLPNKKINNYHFEKMHKFDPQNQKTIQLNPYRRNRKQRQSVNSEYKQKKSQFDQQNLENQQISKNKQYKSQPKTELKTVKIISLDGNLTQDVLAARNQAKQKIVAKFKQRQGPLLKNYKIQRLIKSQKQTHQNFYKTQSFGSKNQCCGQFLNSSTLHSSKRQRLRKIVAFKDYFNNKQQQKLNNYLNKTLFVK